MNEPADGADIPTQKSDAKPALLGVACGVGAALFWALGFVATRHGLKVGFTPADLLMHRFLWSGLAFLPLAFELFDRAVDFVLEMRELFQTVDSAHLASCRFLVSGSSF